jgi:hypothetical protein
VSYIHISRRSLAPCVPSRQSTCQKTVNNFPPFRSVAKFPRLLGAINTLQCHSYTIETLTRCVFDERCNICGNFGDFVYLVTPERWCYSCFLNEPNLGAQRIAPSIMAQDKALQAYPHIPCARLSEGYYGLTGKIPVKQPQIVFDQPVYSVWCLPLRLGRRRQPKATLPAILLSFERRTGIQKPHSSKKVSSAESTLHKAGHTEVIMVGVSSIVQSTLSGDSHGVDTRVTA